MCHQEKRTTVQYIEIGTGEQGQRLDNFLIKKLKQIPRAHIYRIIRKGEVRANKKRIKPAYKLVPGDVIRLPPMRSVQSNAQASIPKGWLTQVESSILFENTHFIAVNKPSGLAVHSGSGVAFGVIDIMRLLRPDSNIELVHRIDLDTSGCLLLARHRQSLLALQHCIQNNTIIKIYTAMVKGSWPAHISEISHRLKKTRSPNGERRIQANSTGQMAKTLILNHQTNGQCSLLTLKLLTGRMHQIRVHCQTEGHAIVGDRKYGDYNFNRTMQQQGMKRLMLHASCIKLPKTPYNEAMVINAPIPTHFNFKDKSINVKS